MIYTSLGLFWIIFWIEVAQKDWRINCSIALDIWNWWIYYSFIWTRLVCIPLFYQDFFCGNCSWKAIDCLMFKIKCMSLVHLAIVRALLLTFLIHAVECFSTGLLQILSMLSFKSVTIELANLLPFKLILHQFTERCLKPIKCCMVMFVIFLSLVGIFWYWSLPVSV